MRTTQERGYGDMDSRRDTRPRADHLELEPFVSVDLRFNKLIRLAASRQIEPFVEGYNILNRVNYAGGGNTSIISAAFLVRNAARDPRQIQLGARVSF